MSAGRRWCARPFAALIVPVLLVVAGTARAALKVTEMNLGCLDGSREVAFLEIKPTSADTFDPRVGLELRGPGGALVADVPGVFGTRSGEFTVGRSFVIATAAFESVTAFAPDAILPAAPHPDEGQVTLYRIAADGVTRQVLDQFAYGPTAFEPPPPGWSLVWENPTRTLSSQPTPETYPHGAITSSCFGAGAPIAGSGTFAISELFLQCADGGTGTQYVELVCTGTGIARGSVQLRFFDRTGERRGTLSNLFGTRNGYPVGSGTYALQGTPTLVPLDATLPVVLDTLAGRIECWEGTYFHSAFRWGAVGAEPPPPGFAIHRDRGWAAFEPSPTTVEGFRPWPATGGCFREVPVGLWISKFAPRCVDGSPRDQFAEIDAWQSGARYYSGLALDVLTAGGEIVRRVPLDFGPLTGNDWSTTPWLIAGRDFDGLTQAVLPDTRDTLGLPLPAGALRLVQLQAAGGIVVLDSLAYGNASRPLPAPGWALERTGPFDWFTAAATARNRYGLVGYSDCSDLCPASTLSVPTRSMRVPLPGTWEVSDLFGWAWLSQSDRTAFVSSTGQGTTRAEFVDDYEVIGVPAGTPVTIFLTGTGEIQGQWETCQFGRCTKGIAWVQFRHSSGVQAGRYAGAGEFQSVSEGFSFQARAGEPFTVTMTAEARHEAGSNGAPPSSVLSYATAHMSFTASDPRVTLRSCKSGAVVLQGSVGAPPAGVLARLSVRRVMPNPARGDSRIAFAVPRTGAVMLDVLDVAGRRVLQRDFGVLAPGEHTRPLASRGELAPGFYMVRVRQGGERATSRVIVTK
jgi:hypothetical protein